MFPFRETRTPPLYHKKKPCVDSPTKIKDKKKDNETLCPVVLVSPVTGKRKETTGLFYQIRYLPVKNDVYHVGSNNTLTIQLSTNVAYRLPLVNHLEHGKL